MVIVKKAKSCLTVLALEIFLIFVLMLVVFLIADSSRK
jgi:hypothetical protein